MKYLRVLVFSLMMISNFKVWSARKSPDNWSKWARDLTGESESVRQKSLKRLRAVKNLNQILANEVRAPAFRNGKINTQKLLAFDVIAALKKKELLPLLMNESLRDPTGYTYHTMNTLLTVDNIDEVTRLYYRHLMNFPNSSAVKIALLDTLGRMGFELSLIELRRLNREATNEVKSALLSYLREIMILRNQVLYQELLPEFMTADSFEIRIQTLYLYEELLRENKMKIAKAGLVCEKDQNKTVQNFCLKIRGLYL